MSRLFQDRITHNGWDSGSFERHTNSDAYSQPDSDTDCNRKSDAYANSNGHGHADRDGHCYCNAYFNANTHIHSKTLPDTKAYPAIKASADSAAAPVEI